MTESQRTMIITIDDGQDVITCEPTGNTAWGQKVYEARYAEDEPFDYLFFSDILDCARELLTA